jgi:hypothetical protein
LRLPNQLNPTLSALTRPLLGRAIVMFRPPDPDPYPRTTIFDLPHELLLHIGAQFTHLKRNRDLASLSLVCKKWRIIAQEWLLKEPRFNLTYIDKYL